MSTQTFLLNKNVVKKTGRIATKKDKTGKIIIQLFEVQSINEFFNWTAWASEQELMEIENGTCK